MMQVAHQNALFGNVEELVIGGPVLDDAFATINVFDFDWFLQEILLKFT